MSTWSTPSWTSIPRTRHRVPLHRRRAPGEGITGGWKPVGKLYLWAVKDACSGRIVGYSMDSRMKSSLAVAALEDSVRARRPEGKVVHSDRGAQFPSRRFLESLRHRGLRGSMGRAGACAGNAAMESFFSLLQKNVLGWH